MRVSDLGEFGLLDLLRRMLGGAAGDLVLGAGDDAAVFRDGGGGLWAYTADALLEGVHFDLRYTPWHALGYRALAASLSDLAAMGGCESSFALVVLGLRGDEGVGEVQEMYRGMLECGERFRCLLAGGDMVRSPHGVMLSVSLVGRLPRGACLTRAGARPGQAVLATGTLGDSRLGMLWLAEKGDPDNPCARRHLYPCPRMEEGRRALLGGATSAIDVSDGLLRDLGHICEESGVGAEVFMEKIPISGAARETAAALGEDPVQAALHGGEDYELLITADPESVPGLCRGLPATEIGRITAGGGVTLVDEKGNEVPAGRIGYDHFRERG